MPFGALVLSVLLSMIRLVSILLYINNKFLLVVFRHFISWFSMYVVLAVFTRQILLLSSDLFMTLTIFLKTAMLKDYPGDG